MELGRTSDNTFESGHLARLEHPPAPQFIENMTTLVHRPVPVGFGVEYNPVGGTLAVVEDDSKQCPVSTVNKPIEDIINIKEENGEILISGRELHEFLGIGTRYDIWFNRMLEYGFVDGQDFTLVVQKRATNNPKNPWTTVTDHAMTIDMAKEISMLQRNEKGKEARQYFIKCEKKLKEVVQYQQRKIPTHQEALRGWADEIERRERLEIERILSNTQ